MRTRLADSVPVVGATDAGRRRRDRDPDQRGLSCVWTTINIDSTLLLIIDLFDPRGTDLATDFLEHFAEEHDLSKLTTSRLQRLSNHYLMIRLEQSSQHHRPKPHQRMVLTFNMGVDRVHNL